MLNSIKNQILRHAFGRKTSKLNNENNKARQDYKKIIGEIEVPDFDDGTIVDLDENADYYPTRPDLLTGFLASFALAVLIVFGLIHYFATVH